jgi:hypothetical protein
MVSQQFLQALLDWSTRAGHLEDAPGPSQLAPMTPERQAWLQEALENAVVDGATLMTRIFEALASPVAQDDQDFLLQSLEELLDLVENIDNASYLGTIPGAWAKVLALTLDHRDFVRAAALRVAAAAIQNNETALKDALETTQLIVTLVPRITDGPAALAARLSLLSSATRASLELLVSLLANPLPLPEDAHTALPPRATLAHVLGVYAAIRPLHSAIHRRLLFLVGRIPVSLRESGDVAAVRAIYDHFGTDALLCPLAALVLAAVNGGDDMKEMAEQCSKSLDVVLPHWKRLVQA